MKLADDAGGTENNIPYDIEFLDGVFTHLAIVDNPRYERANIVFNSKTVVQNFDPNQKRDKKGRWTKENYNAEIDRILKGELKSADRIKVVEHPSEPWLKAGLQDAEMLMSVKTYDKATTDKHNVSEETMRNLPDLINDPLYIFKSSTVPGSYVGVLDDYEEENGVKKPLIAVVKPEHGKIDVNLIPSVYGKDPDFPYREVFKNNLLYERLDKNKTVSNNIIASIAMETLKPSNNIITDNQEDFNPDMKKQEVVNDKWITIKPHGKDSDDYRRIKLEDGETPKEAIERTYKKEDSEKGKKEYTWKNQKYSLQDLLDAGFEPIKYTSSIYKDDPLTYLKKEEGKKYYRVPLTESEYQEALKAKENKKTNALMKAKKESKDLIDYVKWQYNEDIEPYITRKEGDKTIVDWYDLPRGAKSALQQIQRGGRLSLDMYSGREMSIEIIDKKILENLQRHRANNNKENTDMALLDELKKLITKVENNKEQEMTEKIENEKVDKRDIIRQIMAIAGKHEDNEDVRTIAKLAEKLAYDKSEAGTADNVCDDEEEEVKNKKVKNEETGKDKDFINRELNKGNLLYKKNRCLQSRSFNCFEGGHPA